MGVLSNADRAFWETNGYVVVHDAISTNKRRAVIDAIWEFLDMDPARPEGWYRPANPTTPHVAPRRPNGVPGLVEMYHHQTQWDIRQDERVYTAFCEVLGTPELWVSIDRANMNPPVRDGWDYKSSFHIDIDARQRPIPFVVQGVLYLVDTPADKGALEVVPGFHRRLESWVETQPPDRGLAVDMTGLESHPVPGRAGDLVIWHSALPHSNRRNVTTEPRLAAYVSMSVAREHDRNAVADRIRTWEQRLTPGGVATPAHAEGLERARGDGPATLTGLGRKLLGLDSWT